MSWSATAYVKKLKAAPNGTRLTKAQKLLLFVIADYHNEERGDAWASLTHLATESMHSRSGVVRALKSLQIKGILHIISDPDSSRTRVTNRYQFTAIDHITSSDAGTDIHKDIHSPSDHRSPALVTTGHQPSDHRSPALVTTGHHIFPKNLSNQSFQKKEKSTVCELTHPVEPEVGESNSRFQEYWQTYPPRHGKRLEQAASNALFLKLSVQDQALAVQAARNYAEALKAQGLSAKDPKRFLRDGQGHEPWRDWIEPAAPSLLQQRPPPPPPKTDPIGRGHWASVYGNPKDHGYA